MALEKPRHICKVVLLGQAGCGKSCMLLRFLHNRFDPENNATVGAAFGNKTIHLPNCEISLQIWDTAGQERYVALASLYYRNANAAIICCDLANLDSYKQINSWLKKVRNEEKNCKIYVCGNKIDLITSGQKTRQVTSEHLKSFNIPAFETSSKSNFNIIQVFEAIIDDFVNDKNNLSQAGRRKPELIKLGQKKNEGSGRKCCSSS